MATINSAYGLGVPLANVTVQSFTGSGTYTPTTGMKYCLVMLQAPGGGSGGQAAGATNVAGGGGGGGYSQKVFTAATIGASQTVTIGAVGGGGNTSGSNGTAGGTTSLGALLSATGGALGIGSTSGGGALIVSGGAGGVGSSGDLNLSGSAGSSMVTYSVVGGSTTNTILLSGGQSYLGATNTANSNVLGAAIASVAGKNYGSGATPGLPSGATAEAGASGGAGIVYIIEYS